MSKLKLLLVTLNLLLAFTSQAQLFDITEQFSRKDTLRGALRPERTCFDVTYYDLTVTVNIAEKSILGSNNIYFTAVEDFTTLQIDLFEELAISSITYKGKSLAYRREFDAVFVDFPSKIDKGTKGYFTVNYGGNPRAAKNAPWDGGFSWAKDDNDNPWVGISCQGLGASVWWPNKDHLSDEPDSMMINAIVPDDLICIANGNLVGTKSDKQGWKQFSWKVSYPINNYNVTLNIGKYVHFGETFTYSDGDTLAMDYYVLDYNLEKAKKQFAQVKPMMACYEQFLGKFPFPKDGFALVETPYLGMEHQGAIAYGNKYRTGYLGFDFSGIGLDFDYIIIHETSHEWWGNNVSMKDLADMWIHEGFGNYSETMYVECLYGNETAMDYISAMKSNIGNNSPIIGQYDVNNEGSSDMYQKSAIFLNTLRSITDNDALWWSIIKGIQKDFAKQTVTTQQIENYISRRAGKDFSKEFDQFLRNSKLPVLEYKIEQNANGITLNYRWNADVKGFAMPIRYFDANGKASWLKPTAEWQSTTIPGLKDSNFKWDSKHFYFVEKKVKA